MAYPTPVNNQITDSVTQGAAKASGQSAGPDGHTYARLREAALAVVEIAWRVQDPARENPYAPLGAAIMKDAQAILTRIREFQPPARAGSAADTDDEPLGRDPDQG